MNRDLIQKEIELIRKSAETELSQQQFISYIKPLVEKIVFESVEDWVKKYNLELSQEQKKEILRSGWKFFEFAVEKYSAHLEELGEGEEMPYSFTEYFTWFIKQGVRDYVLPLTKKD